VYDEIATHFSQTRAYPWPEVEAFLDGVEAGRRGIDVGCGNGRHAAVLADRVERVLAVDASRGLLGEARERVDPAVSLVQGDAAALPVASGSVDIGLYIATLHHLPDRGARVASLRELARVLAEGGTALVSAWSTAHDRFEEYDGTESAGFDTTIDWTLPGGDERERFYHIYAPAEFEADLRDGGLSVAESYVSSGNCYAEVRPE
jgi:ubiquinone/menaquinone biosynthesis C-methylase UbiE